MVKQKIGYVFDDNEIVQKVPFTQFTLPNGIMCIGLLMPKNIQKTDKDGKGLEDGEGNPIIKQIQSPTIISNKLFQYPSYSFIAYHKIDFYDKPEEMKLRWSLKSIKRFREGKSEVVDGKSLYLLIKKQYDKYIHTHEIEWCMVHSLFDMATYFFTIFQAFPIFELRGVKRTGKSKIMNVSKNISFNAAEKIWINPSESTLFRETHAKRPTKYIDEAERLFRFEKGQLVPDDRIEVINSSFDSDGAVLRQEKSGNKWLTKSYHTYSPTMIGSIKGLFGATEDRALIHITTRAPKDDIRMNLWPDQRDPIWQKIRDQLYLFFFQEYPNVIKTSLKLEKELIKKLSARDFKIWRPILAIAKIIDKTLFEQVLVFAVTQTGIKDSSQIMEGGMTFEILKYVWSFLKEKEPESETKLYVKDIRNSLTFEKMPGFKSVSNTLDKLGFYGFRKKDEAGSFFNFNKNLFHSVISSLDSSFFSSFSSYSSESDAHSESKPDIIEETIEDNPDEYDKKNDESTKKNDEYQGVLPKTDENYSSGLRHDEKKGLPLKPDESDENDEYFEKDREVNMPCSFEGCNSMKTNYCSAAGGKPLCPKHWKD